MKKRTIFTIFFFLCAAGLGYALVDTIKTSIEQEELIIKSEARVIERLKIIREAQKTYQLRYGRYTPSWDSLKQFVRKGVMYNVNKREIVIPKDEIRTLETYYLGDSVRTIYDTLGTIPAINSVFEDGKPTFNLDSIEYIPGKGEKQFKMFVEKKPTGKTDIMADYIEVIDPFPVNPARSDESSNRRTKFLRFGSLNEVSTVGNWEDK
ncbi:hypothetical protein Fleli_0137 [Bernardetia litoralis DSM 6794]|uniref:Uncharacterized protein n=1 Tax=Bernardetia litoralis (strain ATCC 23117 / DSM 6794 / NBRC 15988 / NCIMB 1366 / Fx l1 / Sio-4) TaxID=880071 RepID=I4AFA2_BERLS|nr:hypothetical protein [Bernardetia litoralis]AFM02637.1 hypothetical protein Fleli_0137 [Bernardetia litoralis DSM 6794]